MTDPKLILAMTEVLSQAKETLKLPADNVLLAAKNAAAGSHLSDSNPVLRERMIGIAGLLLAGALLVEDKAIAEFFGVEEDVATNG